MIPVEGHKHLYREESGAIINTDKNGYANYMRAKNKKLSERREIDDLRNEIIKYIDKNFSGNENFIKVVKSSAFCSENNEIISDNYKITKDQKIGIIPPIGGG